jgi:superfamily II DNA/RNA helicase
VGCFRSHIKAIRYAKNKNLSSVLIVEDDIVIRDNITELATLQFPNGKDDWDILYFGGILTKFDNMDSTGKWVKGTIWCNHAYIVNSKMYDIILDEFDKSLQMGFHEQLKVIFFALNKSQKHILTSATRLEELPNFLPFLSVETLDYQHQAIESKLKLNLVKTKSTEKVETLMRLIAGFNQEVCLIFCNHKDAVNRISGVLDKYTFAHGVFHGDLEQIDREKNLIKFRGGSCNVLISTDLAARGLDIPEIKHVVHYQMPVHYEEFVHRNGRTARMHADGEAYLVLAEDETLPIYMHKKDFKEITLPEKLTLPLPPTFVCLYISAGKKDKISKGDIAGLLMKKGELIGEDLGLITILDHSSYVSVNRNKLKVLLLKLKNEKLKKIKVKIEEAS